MKENKEELPPITITKDPVTVTKEVADWGFVIMFVGLVIVVIAVALLLT